MWHFKTHSDPFYIFSGGKDAPHPYATGRIRFTALLVWKHYRTLFETQPGADPELVSRGGAEPMSSAPPLPSPPHHPHSSPPSLLPSPVPSLPSLSLPPSIPFPLPLFPSLPLPSLTLKRGSGGPPPENFEILDCCRRVLAHSGMQKGVCKCVFLGRAMNFFGPSLGGGAIAPPPTVDPPLDPTLNIDRFRWALKTRLFAAQSDTWCQWLKWSCDAGAGGSPDEARLEQTPHPFHTQLIRRYLGIKLHFIDSIRGAHTIAGGGSNRSRGWAPIWPPHFNHCVVHYRRWSSTLIILQQLFANVNTLLK